MVKASARNKMMDYLARRDHSELELRQKLKKAKFTPEEIEKAIDYGKDNNWIPTDEASKLALSEKAANALSIKKKGILYINHFLGEKGLPEVEADGTAELEKATNLIENKFSAFLKKNGEELRRNFEERRKVEAKMMRFLGSRGFEMDAITRVVKAALKK